MSRAEKIIAVAVLLCALAGVGLYAVQAAAFYRYATTAERSP